MRVLEAEDPTSRGLPPSRLAPAGAFAPRVRYGCAARTRAHHFNADFIQISAVLAGVKEFARPWHLIISIAAGVPLKVLEEAFPESRVIRVMPNTPTLVGAGMAALAPGSGVTPEDLALALDLFGAVGQAVVVEERLMDAVTGLSGSGPAFVAVFIEALADAGVSVATSCEQGVCGTCLTRVIEGEPDHRDQYLTPEEQAANDHAPQERLPCNTAVHHETPL